MGPIPAGRLEERASPRWTRVRWPRDGTARGPRGIRPRRSDPASAVRLKGQRDPGLVQRWRSASLLAIPSRPDQEPADGVPFDDPMGGLDVGVEELLEEVPLDGARFPVLVRHRVDGAVVLEELERVLPRARELRHVPTLVTDPRELLDPGTEGPVLQLAPVAVVQLLRPLLQEVLDGLPAELLLDEPKGRLRHVRVRLGEQGPRAAGEPEEHPRAAAAAGREEPLDEPLLLEGVHVLQRGHLRDPEGAREGRG